MNAIFKALNDPTRREILALLKEKEMTAGEIARQFNMAWPSVSYHLDLLKEACLVWVEKDGKYLYYSLNTTGLDAIIQWLAQFKCDRK